jgi:hypothetical protein
LETRTSVGAPKEAEKAVSAKFEDQLLDKSVELAKDTTEEKKTDDKK